MTLPLQGVRVLDFGWVNAGAKGARYLSTYGAEVIHLEWKGRLDILRTTSPPHRVPDGAAPGSINLGSSFNNNHSGKWGISLNMRHPKGKELFRRLLAVSDVVIENYTATTLEGWGFGWERMSEIKPDIVYIQAPGFGRKGPYSAYRTYGPTAAAVGGLTAGVGLPDRDPCGYGVSYMDAIGPYFIAIAAMSALRRRNHTNRGVYVDLSQVGPAILYTGTAIPNWSVNGTPYERVGNRSPHVKAAPHGAYRCAGNDRWIAIACSTDEHWRALTRAMGEPAWIQDPRFTTLDARYANQDDLDWFVEAWTQRYERYELMAGLQEAGVPAGVCQDTQDRYENDPQLRHRGYFVRVGHSEISEYDVEGHPGVFSDASPSPRGTTGWGAACYAEHNPRVYGDLLGLSPADLEALAAEDVI